LILLGLAVAVWFIGGNILVAFHCRRLGQPMWTGLNPFKFAKRDEAIRSHGVLHGWGLLRPPSAS
jgi:hypothetical protein